jgi:hypothetical protein
MIKSSLTELKDRRGARAVNSTRQNPAMQHLYTLISVVQ